MPGPIPNPPAVDAVIHRDPCPDCKEQRFGWVTAWSEGGQVITVIAEYHQDGCPRLASGAAVVMTLPISGVGLGGVLTDRLAGGRE